MATTYLFYADGFAKVGHTMDMDDRLLMLLWSAPPPYVSVDVTKGELVCRRHFDTKIEAVTAERYCQDLLDAHRARASRRGGRCEWFIVGKQEAEAAFHQACDSPLVTFEMDRSTRRRLDDIKRMVGAPSSAEALRMVMRLEIAARSTSPPQKQD